MPGAYSHDWREKVMTALEEGKKKAKSVACLTSAATSLTAG
jgi:hypothetical protein